MPKNIIPLENRKPTEEVRYLEKNKIQELKKSNKKVEKSPQEKPQQNTTSNSTQKSPKEVLEWLIWKDKQNKEFYRVFGEWRCANKKNCGKRWKSAYTWISLQKYKDNVQVSELDKEKDYYQQECKACDNKINKIMKYEHLELRSSDDVVKPHRSDLCAKCQAGASCQSLIKYQQQTHFPPVKLSATPKFLLGFGKRFRRL